MVLVRDIDESQLARSLEWALDRLDSAGYGIVSKVALQVDPALQIMGYAKHDQGKHVVVAAEWALDSEMLGGFLLHELAHIYHTEKQSPSHQQKLIQELLSEMVAQHGLTQTEIGVLTDAFNHLQNILVDDIVFSILTSEREVKMVQKFFLEWVSDKPTGDARMDAAMLVRNAFSMASLRRRGFYQQVAEEISSKNRQFLAYYGREYEGNFETIETLLEKARTDWGEAEFRQALKSYLEQVVALLHRDRKTWEDMR